MTALHMWLTVIAMGAVTYLTRLSFILAWGKFELPRAARLALKYVPTAVLSAIILPELLRPGGAQLDASPFNARWVAGVVAALVAWRTRNTLLTIVTGLLVLWGWSAVLHWLG